MSAHFARITRHDALDQLVDRRLLRGLAYIDGAWTASDAGESFEVTDPASGESLAWIASLGSRNPKACQNGMLATNSPTSGASSAATSALRSRILHLLRSTPAERPPGYVSRGA